MPVSFAPVATLWVTRPVPQCDGKMPYSASSLAALSCTSQSSTQRRKMPSPSKPFTVKPCTTAPCTRWAESVRQLGPDAPALATAMPCSCPPGFSRMTGPAPFCPTRRMPSVDTATAQVAGSVGHGRPASWYVPGATITVSPELAASTAAWIESPWCTWIVFAPAGAARIMSPMIGSHVALLMACPSFCVLGRGDDRAGARRASMASPSCCRGWTRGPGLSTRIFFLDGPRAAVLSAAARAAFHPTTQRSQEDTNGRGRGDRHRSDQGEGRQSAAGEGGAAQAPRADPRRERLHQLRHAPGRHRPRAVSLPRELDERGGAQGALRDPAHQELAPAGRGPAGRAARSDALEQDYLSTGQRPAFTRRRPPRRGTPPAPG